MGRRPMTGGGVSKGRQRIQYDIRLNGVRNRPTLRAIPTEANLRRAREHLLITGDEIRAPSLAAKAILAALASPVPPQK
jgi:hypothetical protein